MEKITVRIGFVQGGVHNMPAVTIDKGATYKTALNKWTSIREAEGQSAIVEGFIPKLNGMDIDENKVLEDGDTIYLSTKPIGNSDHSIDANEVLYDTDTEQSIEEDTNTTTEETNTVEQPEKTVKRVTTFPMSLAEMVINDKRESTKTITFSDTELALVTAALHTFGDKFGKHEKKQEAVAIVMGSINPSLIKLAQCPGCGNTVVTQPLADGIRVECSNVEECGMTFNKGTDVKDVKLRYNKVFGK